MRNHFKLILSLYTGLLLFAGCNTAKRQIASMEVYAVRYPDQFKVLANTLDPCFTGKLKSDTVIKIDSVIVSGKTNVIYTKGKGDTIIKTITIQLPGKIKTVFTKVIDTIPDNRAIQACQASEKIEADSLKQKNILLQDKTKKANKRGLIMWILIVGIGLYIIVKIYLFFSGGFATGIIKKL